MLESVEQLRRQTRLATGREASASSLLEDFGFTGDRLTARVDDLSGGERRRLQFLRLLLAEPNVLLLDEPTNDLDIDTLTVIEDYLDSWPGTLIVVTHDRYFLERTCDVSYALMGDGSLRAAARRRRAVSGVRARPRIRRRPRTGGGGRTSADRAAETRQAKKDLARIESQLAKADVRIARLHDQMAGAASDYARLAALQAELTAAQAEHEALEESWLETAEHLDRRENAR